MGQWTTVLLVLGTLLPMFAAIPENLVSNFTVNLVKTEHAVVLGCNQRDLLRIGRSLIKRDQLINLLNLNGEYSLREALTRWNWARTSVILDCSCPTCQGILQMASDRKYFNKTYQWFIWDPVNHNVNNLVEDLINIGPNTQMTYVNSSADKMLSLYDIHSKGRHLNSPLTIVHYADWKGYLIAYHNLSELQGLPGRSDFGGITLRGGCVIDQDNITTNEQIISILRSPMKTDGVAAFIKYYYDLLQLLQERFNFTVYYRNARGWAGRLGGGTFRLGLLGIVMRNEVDVPASGAFNRINRFAEFDTIYHGWKFDAAFQYRFTTDVDSNWRSGDFLAPFTIQVWLFTCGTIVAIVFVWISSVWLRKHLRTDHEQGENDGFVLKILAALSQQGLDPIPSSLSSRITAFTLLVFSLLVYNYYTSSVVGGLLGSSDQGPKTLAEIIDSPLKVSFEDIGYHKVALEERRSPVIERLYKTKVLPKRNPGDLPVFTKLKEAIPYIKRGGYAFHCEQVDSYPEIARVFDAAEICDLRVITGLMETDEFNWILTKNSMYTELFRIMMCRARESGLVAKALSDHRPKKPPCMLAYTVYPVTISGVIGAFMLLGVGMLFAVLAFIVELLSRGSYKMNRA